LTKLDSLPAGVRVAVEAVRNKKAAEVVVLDLTELGAFTEHFVICTSSSARQSQAISDEVEEQLARIGRAPLHHEGSSTSEWVLLDFGSFLVHIFSEAARPYYDLDRLWRSAKRLDFPGESTRPGFGEASPGKPGTGPASGLLPHER
jgi:ribosome-associated protein